MLAEIMADKRGIAVSGTHGKTTTTSMVASVLDAGGLNPTVLIAIPLLLFHDNFLGLFEAQRLGDCFIWAAAILTLVSMAYYLKAAWPLLLCAASVEVAEQIKRAAAHRRVLQLLV